MRQMLSPVEIEGRQTLMDSQVVVEAIPNSHRRPAKVRLELDQMGVTLPAFAPYANAGGGDWRPRVQATIVGALAIVFGLTHVVVFDLDSGRMTSVTSLFRNANADRGWFTVDLFQLSPHGFVIVYEGGAMLIAPDGTLRWHLTKAWDDVLVGEPHSELRFLSGDEEEFSVRVADGTYN